MRISGEHRGVKWSADVRALADITANGKTVTRGFAEWPEDLELAGLAEAHIDRSVDGLPPVPEIKKVAPGDVAPAAAPEPSPAPLQSDRKPKKK